MEEEERGGWVSASDLADYAYCPRAHWYQRHPPRGAPGPAASARRGVRFHRRELRSERRREESAGIYLLLAILGVALVVGTILLGVLGR